MIIEECANEHDHRTPVISKENLAIQQAPITIEQEPQGMAIMQQSIPTLFHQNLQSNSYFLQDVDESRQKAHKKSRRLGQESQRELQRPLTYRQLAMSLFNHFDTDKDFENYLKSIKEEHIAEALTPYILTIEQLSEYGYPINSPDLAGCAMINYTPYPGAQQPEFPDLSKAGYSESSIHVCARCNKLFNYLNEESCTYHWGKLWDVKNNGKHWTCCRKDECASGCTTAEMHVWTGVYPGHNGPLAGFVHAKPDITPKTLRVVAIDCEMCFTKNGLEVSKVTVVDICGNIVYQKLIKPINNIIDYNTRFSGIRKEDMQDVTDNLRVAQHELLQFISTDTIIIGHGLESDLRVLNLLHEKVIDTSFAYPHPYGFPYRNSLKSLTGLYLKRFIQKTMHDPAEDAKAAMDLMIAKISPDNFTSDFFLHERNKYDRNKLRTVLRG